MIASLLLASALAAPQDGWKSLFNGRNLNGWTPKITGYPLGENFGRTFRVEDNLLQVRYDAYDEFRGRFGHLHYRTPYSKYQLRLEYRFVGEQVKGGPGWAWRNSGIMFHGQDPATMRKDQDFPVSGEFQMLGGAEQGDRPTANLCTPGTNFVEEGKLVTRHCTNSKSETFRGDQWVQVELEVHGSGEVVHRVNGKEVMRYSALQLDPADADGAKLIKDGKLLIEKGWISLQSESHPIDFRNIMIRELK